MAAPPPLLASVWLVLLLLLVVTVAAVVVSSKWIVMLLPASDADMGGKCPLRRCCTAKGGTLPGPGSGVAFMMDSGAGPVWVVALVWN